MYGKRVVAGRYTKVLSLLCPIPLVPLVWVLRGSWLSKSLRFLYRKSPFEKVKTATSIVATTIVHTIGLLHSSNLIKYLPWSKIEMPLLVT